MKSTMEQYFAVMFCVCFRKTATESFSVMQEDYGEENMMCRCCFYGIRHFLKAGNLYWIITQDNLQSPETKF
jgi:hypothetical protein